MTAPTVGTEADRYLQRVRAALADLPDDERNELIDDLSAHLADIAAETPDTLTEAALVERLGRPEAYAAELRASAGLAPAPESTVPSRVRNVTDRVRTTLDGLPAYRRFRAFLPELRPGWWVLRGYFAAVVVTGVFWGGFNGVLPGGGAEAFAFLILAAAAAYASVWLGRRTASFGRWAQRAVLAGGIFVALVGLGIVTQPNHDSVGYAQDYYYAGNLEGATDLRIYGPDGQLIRDAQVFDQNGNPILLPSMCEYVPRTRTDGGVAENVYPRSLNQPPDLRCEDGSAPVAERLPGLLPTERAAPTAEATPEPEESPLPSASGTPVPSGTPTPTPSGTGTPSATAPSPSR
ncbi:HAAS signaling domain-containing protein [Cryptosporangium aurantiacum]|uniref:Uncharacterized membrane protein n=1 Tax=Cryptosporangium aurantiacum TaxID=134849 RepID=A0A1M7Q3F7_9ACTN|nr:hypothetical protein [Cryptosporangium aurantiacum]SHN24701.1 Uncharacterized membrane protein [Cryptosporangium aurantiacum]